MARSQNIYLLIFALIISVTSCSESKHNDCLECDTEQDTSTIRTENKYAVGFTIEYINDNTKITVNNPWDSTQAYHTYILTPKGKPVSENINSSITVIETPVERVAALSATHIGLLQMLGLEDKIIAISNKSHVYNQEIRTAVDKGSIQEIGEQQNLNIEKALELSPDLVFLTGWAEISNKEKRLIDFNYPLVYNIEWMEKSPLGRAEWIKFIGAFFNKQDMADSIFNCIEKRYNDLVNLAGRAKSNPTILHGFNYKGTWYVPGGQSYISILYKDAGADYYWKNDPSSGSLPLSLETVIDKAINADFWFNTIMTDSASIQLQENSWSRKFKAFTKNNLYCNNARVIDSGGNDYWEYGLMNPDKLLADMISIFHPELLPDHELYFYKKINVENCNYE